MRNPHFSQRYRQTQVGVYSDTPRTKKKKDSYKQRKREGYNFIEVDRQRSTHTLVQTQVARRYNLTDRDRITRT